MVSMRRFVLFVLLLCHLDLLLAEEPSSVDVVRRFQLALALKDEFSLRRLALPDPDLSVLWEGEKPGVEQLGMICLALDSVKVEQVGEERQGDREIARVRRSMPGREEPAIAVVRMEDGWRIDARPFVQMILRHLGRVPSGSSAETWKSVLAVDQFLAACPALWGARLDDLARSPQGAFFQSDREDASRVVYRSAAGRPVPTFFGQPVARLELAFREGCLDGLTVVLHDARTAAVPSSGAQAQETLKQADRALRKVAKSSGRFRQRRPDPENRAWSVRAREWRLPGTLLRLEAVLGAQPEAGGGGEEAVVLVRVRAVSVAQASGAGQSEDQAVPGRAQEVLAALGTDVSPHTSAFWEQSTLGFLGSLTARCHAHWTAEQGADGTAGFRCTYVRRPGQEARDGKPVRFVQNQPLAASRLTFFGQPVVAMTASFREDRLVAFHFDFWNKGDGAPDAGEEAGEAAVKEMLERLRGAGLDFRRTSGSQDRISRVRDTRYSTETGPTRITLVVQKGEYYSLLLEAVDFAATGDGEERERASGRELRTVAKGQVIRIASEQEAAKYPGVVRVGDVFVQVPMVDQGPKGYCAPATLTRVVQYYGRETTMNEMAAMMGTEDGGGTRVSDIRESVRKVTRRLRMSFREEEAPTKGRLDSARRVDRWIRKAVIEYIDNGNPIFWTVPEHIRLIVGYNERTREVLFSDSWGGKGYDRIPYQEAANATDTVWIIR